MLKICRITDCLHGGAIVLFSRLKSGLAETRPTRPMAINYYTAMPQGRRMKVVALKVWVQAKLRYLSSAIFHEYLSRCMRIAPLSSVVHVPGGSQHEIPAPLACVRLTAWLHLGCGRSPRCFRNRNARSLLPPAPLRSCL